MCVDIYIYVCMWCISYIKYVFNVNDNYVGLFKKIEYFRIVEKFKLNVDWL